jgi:hypothetical protein
MVTEPTLLERKRAPFLGSGSLLELARDVMGLFTDDDKKAKLSPEQQWSAIREAQSNWTTPVSPASLIALRTWRTMHGESLGYPLRTDTFREAFKASVGTTAGEYIEPWILKRNIIIGAAIGVVALTGLGIYLVTR